MSVCPDTSGSCLNGCCVSCARVIVGMAEIKLIAQNKKARHEYQVLDTYEAGIVLQGSEVKSCRQGGVNLKDELCPIDGTEISWSTPISAPTRTPTASTTSRSGRASCCCTAADQQADGRGRSRRHDALPSSSISTSGAASSCCWRWPRARNCTTSARACASAISSSAKPSARSRTADSAPLQSGAKGQAPSVVVLRFADHRAYIVPFAHLPDPIRHP